MKANNNNYCVIMAGGIGSRFWPYSRDMRPKQFLDFFGTGRSLIQMTVDRFRSLVPIENMLVVTNVNYKTTILEQIPDMKPEQVLCEPARRNTAPCIAYATEHIRAISNGKANIVVTPSDSLVMQPEEFQKVIATGLDFVENNNNILTLGMKPTRPETGYGYIQVQNAPKQINNEVLSVKTFTEKPNLDLAKVFYESGEFLWNSGIFLFNLQTIRRALCEHLPDLMNVFARGEGKMGTAEEDNFIQQAFPTCPNVSIDYGVMEKERDVRVLPASFGWSDLGTWGSLYDLGEKDEEKNVALHGESMFYESNGNVVTTKPGKLVVAEGLQDMIVADTEDVLLICRKQNEQQIRQIVKDVTDKYNGKFN